MLAPHRERQWLTLRAAFGHKSAARALALQVQTKRETPTEFRLVSNLSADRAWHCEGSFPRSDLAYRAYQARLAEARLTDYFSQPPKQTPPRWLIPSPEGVFLTAPVDRPPADRRPPAHPPFWQRLLHVAGGR